MPNIYKDVLLAWADMDDSFWAHTRQPKSTQHTLYIVKQK